MDLRTQGYDDATSGVDAKSLDPSYAAGYEEGLIAQVKWAQDALAQFVKAAHPDYLSPETKDRIIQECHDSNLQGMFGDGMESDYVMDGVTIIGLNEMTDDDLVEEYELCSGDEEDELLAKARAERVAFYARKVVE